MKIHRFLHTRSLVFAIVLALTFSVFASAQSKRPLNVKDFDAWRSFSAQTLSRNGEYLAYGLFPQDGDGEVIVRNLKTGTEWKQPAGARPEPPRPDPLAGVLTEDAPPQERNVTIEFSADGKTVVFSTFPKKADVAKAKKDKKKPEDMPKNSMVIMDLATGSITRVENIKNFQVSESGMNVLAYLREAAKEKAVEKSADTPAEKDVDVSEDAGQDQAAAPPVAKPPAKKKDYGTELVLRDLETSTEKPIADVLDYKLSKDGGLLVYAVASRKEENNGLFAASTSNAFPLRTILAGRGRYLKMAWDEPQIQLAFFSDHDSSVNTASEKSNEKQPKYKLYRWDRKMESTTELASASTAGFRDGCAPSDKSNITFSRNGEHLFFGCATPGPVEKDAEEIPEDEKVNVDLWHWKDDFIQPMQKVRAEAEKVRTYRCVVHIADKKLVQLADATMQDLTPSESGLYALGMDDRAYRAIVEYDTRYFDTYIVDTHTGTRTLAAKKHQNRLNLSPSGRNAVYFDGKDWLGVSIPEGKTTNLTAGLGVKFFDEEDDHPAVPPSHGMATWTNDGKYVLIYDEFDIWRIAPSGGTAVNLTAGAGRKERLIMRYVRQNNDNRNPDSRWIDPAKPFLIRAVNKDTRDSGIYRTSIDAAAAPVRLLTDSKNFSAPVKAKDADVYMLTASTFQQFPDLQVTDSSFKSLKKVTDANPQITQFLWGTAEMVHFRNADGVALSGILYKPENFDPKKKYPLMVYIYEKLSDTLNNFVVPQPSHRVIAPFYTSKGYMVLMPDIVYTNGHPGQSALKCVLPAVQAVVDRGFVDEKAIGIQGHSWGGYQIAYMITQTDRFRAVAAGAPVANMTSAYDGIRWGPGIPRQFQYEKSQSRIGGTLWEKTSLYIENSPLFAADHVHTPLLIIHNDADDAVPWYQGIEYFLALRRLGREAYLFTYNGEPHGLRRRADQKDYTIRLQQFFDHFLKGAPEPEWMTKGIPYLDREKEKERLKEKTGVY